MRSNATFKFSSANKNTKNVICRYVMVQCPSNSNSVVAAAKRLFVSPSELDKSPFKPNETKLVPRESVIRKRHR